MAKLDVQHLSLDYGPRSVIRDISFQLQAGDILGLVGPNGCGKSSIIKSLSRVLIPTSGKILLNGRELKLIHRNELARIIGVVPQNPYLPETFTVSEVVILGRNPHLGLFSAENAHDIDIVSQAMLRTGITHLAARKIGELSGGERQRVTIARVLAQEPQVILMDEPTANLDTENGKQVMEIMQKLNKETGVTFVFATHDPRVIKYARRVVTLHDGLIEKESRSQ